MSRCEDGNQEMRPPEPSLTLRQRAVRELRFAWNLVNPLHGRTTVYVSKQTGEIIRREIPQKRQ